MESMQQVVADYIRSWSELDPPQFVIPNVQDAVSFMVTEAGESLDEVLRQKNYVRNNPGGGSQERLIEEVADTVFMAYVTAIAAGCDLNQALLAKLERMDRNRRERAQAAKA